MNSIKENQIFRRVYYKGKKQVSDAFVLYYLKNKTDSNLLGITVSKKNGNAVVRNRIRRLVRENCRQLEGNLNTGYYLVIVARNKAAGASFDKVSDCLRKLFEKAEILNI